MAKVQDRVGHGVLNQAVNTLEAYKNMNAIGASNNTRAFATYTSASAVK